MLKSILKKLSKLCWAFFPLNEGYKKELLSILENRDNSYSLVKRRRDAIETAGPLAKTDQELFDALENIERNDTDKFNKAKAGLWLQSIKPDRLSHANSTHSQVVEYPI